MGKLDQDDMYNGCYGLLQRNVSDLILGPSPFPFHHHGLTHGIMANEMAIQIVSTYNCSIAKSKEEVIILDCMDSLNSFNWTLWLLILFSVFALFPLLMKITSRIKVSLFEKVWISATFMWKQASFTSGNFNQKLVQILLSVFIFIISSYYCNLIKTDLVSVKEPSVMKSYEDIVESLTMRPVLWSDLDDFKFFESASPETGAGRLWQKIHEFGRKRCMFPMSFPELKGLNEELLKFDRVSIVMLSMFIRSMQLWFCNQYAEKEVCSFLAEDVENFRSTYGFMAREGIIGTETWRSFLRSNPFFRETGLLVMNLERMADSLVPINTLDPKIRQCLSKSIVVHPPSYSQMSLRNVTKVLIWYGAMKVTAIIALLCELLVLTSKKREKRSQLTVPLRVIQRNDRLFEKRQREQCLRAKRCPMLTRTDYLHLMDRKLVSNSRR